MIVEGERAKLQLYPTTFILFFFNGVEHTQGDNCLSFVDTLPGLPNNFL